jgi:hypothetical protein
VLYDCCCSCCSRRCVAAAAAIVGDYDNDFLADAAIIVDVVDSNDTLLLMSLLRSYF